MGGVEPGADIRSAAELMRVTHAIEALAELHRQHVELKEQQILHLHRRLDAQSAELERRRKEEG